MFNYSPTGFQNPYFNAIGKVSKMQHSSYRVLSNIDLSSNTIDIIYANACLNLSSNCIDWILSKISSYFKFGGTICNSTTVLRIDSIG